MEFQTLLNALFGAVLMLSGWVIRTIWDAVNNLKRDIQEIERNLPDTYVRRDDYRDDMIEVKDMLKAIFNKLDNKADK